jgi:hypothetical protein
MTAIASDQLDTKCISAKDLPMTVYMAAEIFPTWPLASIFIRKNRLAYLVTEVEKSDG